jgi:hypothetical protein
VDAGIENFFCSVAMRYGHSMVNSQVFLADNDYKQSPLGNILVRDWYLYVTPTLLFALVSLLPY